MVQNNTCFGVHKYFIQHGDIYQPLVTMRNAHKLPWPTTPTRSDIEAMKQVRNGVAQFPK